VIFAGRIGNRFILRVKLYHEEHEDVVLPKGDYEVRQQREYDWIAAGRRGQTGFEGVHYAMD
jgi:hypothetical protein